MGAYPLLCKGEGVALPAAPEPLQKQLNSVLSLYSGDCEETKPPTKNSWDWDILIFVQNWPETVCKEYMSMNASHTCRYPNNKDAWSVHGIWPSKGGGIGPSKCNRTAEYDPEEIASIETELEQVWTDVHGDWPSDDFWSAEWDKHGTCALTLPSLDTEFKYFNQAITWLKMYSMTDILSNANIKPSSTRNYPVEDFSKAINSKLGVKPFVSCYSDCSGQYLHELRICFDKQLKLTDCVPYTLGSSVITDCNVTQSVVYPEVSKKASKYQKVFGIDYWFDTEEEKIEDLDLEPIFDSGKLVG